jgi:hypothetical protein
LATILILATLAVLAALPTITLALARLTRLAALVLANWLAGIVVTERVTGDILRHLVVSAIVALAILLARLTTLALALAALTVLATRAIGVRRRRVPIRIHRRCLSGVAELLAVGGLVAHQLLGQIGQLVLGKSQGRRIVAEDGLRCAFNAGAKLFDILRRAGLEWACLADQSVLQQLRAILQIIRRVKLRLLAQ